MASTEGGMGTGRKLRGKVRSVMRSLESVLGELKTVMGDLKLLATQIDAVVEKIDPQSPTVHPTVDSHRSVAGSQKTFDMRGTKCGPSEGSTNQSDGNVGKPPPTNVPRTQPCRSSKDSYNIDMPALDIQTYIKPSMDTSSNYSYTKSSVDIANNYYYTKPSMSRCSKTAPLPEYPSRVAYKAYSNTTLSSGYCEEIPSPNIRWGTFLESEKPVLGVQAKVVGKRRKVGPRPASSITDGEQGVDADRLGDHTTEDSNYFSHDSNDGMGRCCTRQLEVPRVVTSALNPKQQKDALCSSPSPASPCFQVSHLASNLATPESGHHSCECQPVSQDYCGIYEEELDRRLESEYEDGSSLESSCCMDFVGLQPRARRRELAMKRRTSQQSKQKTCLPSPSCQSAGFDEGLDSDDEFSDSSLESVSVDQVYRNGFFPKTLSPNLVNYSWRIVIKP